MPTLVWETRTPLEAHVAQKAALNALRSAAKKGEFECLMNLNASIGSYMIKEVGELQVREPVTRGGQLQCHAYFNNLVVKLHKATCRDYKKVTDMMEHAYKLSLDKRLEIEVARNYFLDVLMPILVYVADSWEGGLKCLVTTIYFSTPPEEGAVKTQSTYAAVYRDKNHYKKYNLYQPIFHRMKELDPGLEAAWSQRYSGNIVSFETKLFKIYAAIEWAVQMVRDSKKPFELNKYAETNTTTHVQKFTEWLGAFQANLQIWVQNGKKLPKLSTNAVRALEAYKAMPKPTPGRTEQLHKVAADQPGNRKKKASDDGGGKPPARKNPPPTLPTQRTANKTPPPPPAKRSLAMSSPAEQPPQKKPARSQRAASASVRETVVAVASDDEDDATGNTPEAEPYSPPEQEDDDDDPPTAAGAKGKKVPLYSDGSIKNVDHANTQGWKDIEPGVKYLQCPHCDAAKVIPANTPGYASFKVNKQPCGRLPVDNNTLDLRIHKLPVWKKHRANHVKKCTIKRLINTNQDRLELHGQDDMYLESLLPVLWRQTKKKYSTQQARIGNKPNHKFLKEQRDRKIAEAAVERYKQQQRRSG